MKNMKRSIALLVAIALLIGCAAGGTMAWLTMKTDTVVNTFTTSDVTITLSETTGDDYKMVPGLVLPKDPKVTVAAGSEACWLFVEIEKSTNYDDYLELYEVADGWTQGDGALIPDNVYYRTAVANDNFYVLADNDPDVASDADNGYVVVKADVTKADMALIDGVVDTIDRTAEAEIAARPTLTFTAYAIQQAGFDTVQEAWDEISNP